MKDYRIIQRQRAQELQRKGYTLVAEGITAEEYRLKCQGKEFPPYTTHLWAIEEAWAPKPKERAQ